MRLMMYPQAHLDPYTGQNVTHEGYHVNNTILVMTIQNQPFGYQFNGNESFAPKVAITIFKQGVTTLKMKIGLSSTLMMNFPCQM